MKRYTVIILVVFVISQLALSSLIMGLSNRAQKQRSTNMQLLEQQQENTRNGAIAINAFECILLIEPQMRDQNIVDQCKADAAAMYNE